MTDGPDRDAGDPADSPPADSPPADSPPADPPPAAEPTTRSADGVPVSDLETAGPLPTPGIGDDDGPVLPARPDGSDDGGDGTRSASNLVAVLASTAGFEATVWVLVRYVPEYLQTLGVGAPLIGALGTLWLLGRRLGTGGSSPRRWRVVAGALAAAVGLSLWALVPELAAGSAVTASLVVAAGGVGVAAWARFGPDRSVGRWSLADWNDTASPDRSGWAVAALTVAVVIFALARSFEAGYRVSLTLTAALGVTVAALWATGGFDGSGSVPAPSGGESPVRSRERPSLGRDVSRFGLTMVSLFVVVAVTTVLDVDLVLFGRRLSPAATFGLFLVAELATAAVVARVGPRVVDVVGARAATVYASVVVAAFPLVLVTVPATPLVVGAVFAVYGTRSVGRVARSRTEPRGEATGTDTARSDLPVREVERPDGPHSTGRTAGEGRTLSDRRALAVATAPLLGGVLYAVDPVLAFGVATAVGAVGAWETVRRGWTRTG
ncbi:hypothetical protein SAMN05216559_2379 [Halomicrobium zhouii]|uniref:Major Facilitator Superfamily protein n=1 Tax=Halomicrobium zhouii TaxID=767519 RepID=A0A1I6LAU9_9EURY|nr:hypothetical protein [Halomicrobium zhouii]SFS00581.1 hypothetical protein SAMN05216559_2379 [Halomicrobium zhouii]